MLGVFWFAHQSKVQIGRQSSTSGLRQFPLFTDEPFGLTIPQYDQTESLLIDLLFYQGPAH